MPPAAAKLAPVADAGAGSRLEPKQMHVLIVDDDRDTLDALSDLLGQLNYVTTTCTDGEMALSILKGLDDKTLPTLIILDVFMPRMNGLEFRKAQLANHRLADIPVIIISGYHLNGAWRAQLQAIAYFSKPYEVAKLIELLDEYDPVKRRVLMRATADVDRDSTTTQDIKMPEGKKPKK